MEENSKDLLSQLWEELLAVVSGDPSIRTFHKVFAIVTLLGYEPATHRSKPLRRRNALDLSRDGASDEWRIFVNDNLEIVATISDSQRKYFDEFWELHDQFGTLSESHIKFYLAGAGAMAAAMSGMLQPQRSAMELGRLFKSSQKPKHNWPEILNAIRFIQSSEKRRTGDKVNRNWAIKKYRRNHPDGPSESRIREMFGKEKNSKPDKSAQSDS